MHDEIEAPIFDEFIKVHGRLLVVHRDVNGKEYACHSPLEKGPVRCTFCETAGNRVYVRHTVEDCA